MLTDLAQRYEPARQHAGLTDPRACADALSAAVAAYVETKAEGQ